MKTTVEIPDQLYRESKALAASKGQIFKAYLEGALYDKLASATENTDRPWMRGFGKLSGLRDENRRILHEIDEAFERIDPEQVR